MIISASRRTDIPAFYSEWFMNRIREGYYIKVNPFNRKQTKVISLLPKDVDVIVFWTKNAKPMRKHLPELKRMGYSFLFHVTLNDYPKEIEPGLPSLSYRIKEFKELSIQVGPENVIWRYDPIVLSNKTNQEYHIEHFNRIARELSSYTKRVVISFQDFYVKTKRRLLDLERNHGYTFSDWLHPDNKETLDLLARQFSRISSQNGLEIVTCAEEIDLDIYGIKHGACIDSVLMEKVSGKMLSGKKDKYQRTECGCMEAEEMGTYDTCPFGCAYCYAVRSDKMVRNNQQKHDPNSPFLITNG